MKTKLLWRFLSLTGLLAMVVTAGAGCNLPVREDATSTPTVEVLPSPTPTDTLIPFVATQWYVETSGNDASDCLSQQTACQHIAAAIERAGNGDIINIGTGSFFENLTVAKSLTFLGQGVDKTVVDGNHTGLLRSIFYLEAGTTSTIAVSLNGFTIQNGVSAHDENGLKGNGGGISAVNVDLTLDHMRIADSWSNFDGGGIYCKSTTNPKNWVSITNSFISGNEAGFDGGGIWSNADLSLENVRLEGNIANSTELGNKGKGVGIYSEGNMELKNVQMIGNVTTGSRGALHFFAPGKTLTIEDSVIDSANHAGGIFIELGNVEIRRTTISNNHLFGIDNRSSLLIENSTISGTKSGNLTGGLGTSFSATAIINNVTIVGNDIGLAATMGGHAILSNTLLSGNVQTCFTAEGAGYQTSSIEGDHNLATNNNCGAAVTDITDAMLGALGNNGGTTNTYALLPGSPAIDAGKVIPGLSTDQRGFPRPTDGNGNGTADFDVGAYESEAVAALPTKTPTITPSPTSTLTPTFTPTQTQTVPAGITFTSRVSVNAFQYKQDCVPNPGEVTLTAILSSTSGVSSVLLFYRLENSALGIKTDWNEGVMMSPAGSGEYKKTVSWSDIPNLALIKPNSATLSYQFVALAGSEVVSRSPVYGDVSISRCP